MALCIVNPVILQCISPIGSSHVVFIIITRCSTGHLNDSPQSMPLFLSLAESQPSPTFAWLDALSDLIAQ